MASIINTGPGQKDAGAQLYLDTLKGYQDREAMYQGNYGGVSAGYERLYANQAQFGESEKLRLNQDFSRQLADSQQSMISRGLGNTTALDSAARGINYDRANAGLTLNDQLLQRQNQIAQQKLGYNAQYQQGLAGLQGERLGWMGNVQGQTQQQNFAGAQQAEGYAYQDKAAQNQFNYQQAGAAQNFQYQQQAGREDFNNKVNYQNMFGYYADGGAVPPIPPPSGTDTVGARLTPGEFVLSREMIAALEQGTLDSRKLVQMIHQDQAQTQAPQSFAHGGMVHSDLNHQRMREEMARKEALRAGLAPAPSYAPPVERFAGGGFYQTRGRYG